MSTVKVGTLQNLSGTEVYTCKAWVNFNGTGTVAIRASGNVSSITDNGAGIYIVNFATAMIDNKYAPHVTTHRFVTWNDGGNEIFTPLASSVGVGVIEGGVNVDTDIVSVTVFR